MTSWENINISIWTQTLINVEFSWSFMFFKSYFRRNVRDSWYKRSSHRCLCSLSVTVWFLWSMLHWDLNRLGSKILTFAKHSCLDRDQNQKGCLGNKHCYLCLRWEMSIWYIICGEDTVLFAFVTREMLDVCLPDQDLFANNYELRYPLLHFDWSILST